MRILLVGAFPYPLSQGSQVYFREQARALREAGADVELLTYASGLTEAESDWRSDDFVHHTPPASTAPRRLRSGPSWGKPRADWALAMTLRQRIASFSGHDAYDAVLTHNAEACLAGWLGPRERLVPHVYCAHTLLAEELPTYISVQKRKGFSAASHHPSMTRRVLEMIGRRFDRGLARRVDGWIALTHSAQRVMRQASTCPGECIAPPIPDPRLDPDRLDANEVAQRHGLEHGGFFLYSGNLDGYQEIEILEAAALLLGQAIADPERRPVLVVASHDASGAARVAEMAGVEFRHVVDAAEMQALISAATATVVMRQAVGGYPIKLANAHAAGTPSVAFHGREWGLRDGEDSIIAMADRPAATLAGSILKLAGDADLVARLGVGARRLYEAQHRPDLVATRTLGLIARAIEAHHALQARSIESGR
jgi:glycosyltransferase involved in cell wall biosynthesis